MEQQSLEDSTSVFSTWFTESFKLVVENYCSEKKDFFQNIAAHCNAPDDPRALIKMYHEINVF